MNPELSARFDRCWLDFATTLRGRLITRAKSLKLTANVANMALAETATQWTAPDTIQGRWLDAVRAENSAKADLISQILSKDMKFTSLDTVNTSRPLYRYGVPFIGAVCGSTVAKVVGAGLVGTILWTLIPFGALLLSGYGQPKSPATIALIDAYMAQLDVFKTSVDSVLQSQ